MLIPYNSVSVSSGTPEPSFYSYLFLLVIISFIAIRRVSRGVRGSPFRTSRILRGPVIYGILSVVFIFVLSPFNYDIYATILFLPIGMLLGLRVGSSVLFFMNENVVYYKRSPVILVFWIVSFMARIVLEILYPNVVIAEIFIDALLALTAGLITGEAFNLINREKVYSAENFPKSAL